MHHGLDAVQTGDAAADLLAAAFFGLLAPVRVGKQRTGEADDILVTLFEEFLRLFRGTDHTGLTDGDGDSFLDRFRVVFSPAELIGGGFAPGVHGLISAAGEVEELDTQLFEFLRDAHTFVEGVADIVTEETIVLVNGETGRNRIVRSAELVDLFDDLLDDAGPVLERTAVFVGAAIGVGREELLQEIAV